MIQWSYIKSFILILAKFQLYDCLVWSQSLPYLQSVWVNNTASIKLSWQYQVTASDIVNQPNSIRISCGFINGPDFVKLTVRKADAGLMATISDTNVLSARVVPVFFNDSRTVGFQINNVQKSDPTNYRCEAIVDQVNDASNDFNSPITTIQVLDRPSFVNCLSNLPPVQSNQDLQITCLVTGNPTPSLFCQLLSYTGAVLNTLPSSNIITQNITQLTFKAVQAEASSITCTAFHDLTGSQSYSTAIKVNHPPFAPRNFVITPLTTSSLLLTWTKIPPNETSYEFDKYRIEYYVTRLGILNKTSIDVKDDGNQNSLNMQYTLYGLVTEDYTVVVFGQNKYGTGVALTVNVTPSYIKPVSGALKSSNTGKIVGAVIGGVVAAIIIAVIVIWFTKRSEKNKRYPMSYVEDAVDYPLNQDKSLYAGVDKKKKPPHKDSTSGYPDVVLGANDEQKTYEMSSKVYV